MSLLSKRASQLVNLGALAVALVFVLRLGLEDHSCGSLFILGVGAGVMFAWYLRGETLIARHEEAEQRRLKLASTAPLEAIADDLEETTRALAFWSRWLAIAAFAVAVLAAVGACPESANYGAKGLVSALVWVVLAIAAWFVRDRASRVAAVVLLAVPLANLVATAVAMIRVHPAMEVVFRSACVSVVLVSIGLKCCTLTFRYHRRLRLVG